MSAALLDPFKRKGADELGDNDPPGKSRKLNDQEELNDRNEEVLASVASTEVVAKFEYMHLRPVRFHILDLYSDGTVELQSSAHASGAHGRHSWTRECQEFEIRFSHDGSLEKWSS